MARGPDTVRVFVGSNNVNVVVGYVCRDILEETLKGQGWLSG